MAFAKFKLGTSTEYTGAAESFKEYIYACSDTRDVYVFGVKQQGLTDGQFEKVVTNFDQSVKDVITSVKNVANGIAGLDENGHLDPSLINGVVGHSVELADFVTANPGEVTEGAKYFNSTSSKILEGKSGVWVETDPESGILYVRLSADEKGRTNTIYRWSGSAMAFVSDSIVVGEVAGTAYDGAKGKANRDALDTLPSTAVTGFGAVTPDASKITIAYTDSDKTTGTNKYAAGDGGNIEIPAATGTAAGLMSAADKAALDSLSGEGEGSLSDLKDKVGDTAGLTTDAKDSLVDAINEVDAAVDEVAGNLTTLEAAVVKKIKPGTGAELTPTSGLVTIPVATGSADGVMSAADKTKIDKIVTNGGGTKYLADNGTYQTVSMNLSDGYKASEEVNEALEPAAGDSYETAIGKLHKAILDNEEVTTGALVNFQTVLGTQNPNQTLPDLSGTNYLNGKTTFVECLKALDTALKTIADQAATITDLTSRVEALEEALTLKTV